MADHVDHIAKCLISSGRPSTDYDLNPEVVLPQGRVLRPAAVLVPIIEHDGQLKVVLTMRSSALQTHPGQIAFPGGKVDPSDGSVEVAALREAEEEIGLPRACVSLLGRLPSHETVTGFTVTPIVGLITDAPRFVPEPGEVEEVFLVPLSHVTDPSHFAIQSRLWQGQQRHYYTVPFGPYYIWGATARILRAFADQVAR